MSYQSHWVQSSSRKTPVFQILVLCLQSLCGTQSCSKSSLTNIFFVLSVSYTLPSPCPCYRQASTLKSIREQQLPTAAPHSFQSQILLVLVNFTNSPRILSQNKAVGSIQGNNVYLRLQNTTCTPCAEAGTLNMCCF